jgi:hypothetical protein
MAIEPITKQGARRMWPSLEAATRAADIATFVFVGSLVVGVVATAVIVWMANVKEAHREHERELSRERLAQVDKDIALAHQRAATAELRAEEERGERLKLEERIAPRSLTPEQQTQVSKNLRPLEGRKKVRVLSYALDAEGSVLAEQIIACLESAGINVANGVASLSPTSGITFGVHVDGTDDIAHAIAESLSGVGRLAVIAGPRAFNMSGLAGADVALLPPSAFAATVLVGVKPPLRK